MTHRRSNQSRPSAWQFAVARDASVQARTGAKRPDVSQRNKELKSGVSNSAVSKARAGKPSWNAGVPMREESKRKLSARTKGVSKPRVAAALRDRRLPKKTCRLISRSLIGLRWYTNGTENRKSRQPIAGWRIGRSSWKK